VRSRSSFSTALPSRTSFAAALSAVVLGHSVDGRPIKAVERGDPSSPRKALVVGSIHGDEPAGLRVTRALRKLRATGVDLWIVDTANPDGLAAHRRTNARGVDLNRDFGRFSQPETRAIRRFVLKLKPAVSIWYHQPWDAVLTPRCGSAPPIERRYARRAHMRLSCRGHDLHGVASKWERRVVRGSSAFVVELPSSGITPTAIRRHARAALDAAEGR
jgi:murein peptide amidase A